LGVRRSHSRPHKTARKSLKSNVFIMSQTLRDGDAPDMPHWIQIDNELLWVNAVKHK
jgi:hypothetical protein